MRTNHCRQVHYSFGKSLGDGKSVNKEREKNDDNSWESVDKSSFYLSCYFLSKLFAFRKLSF